MLSKSFKIIAVGASFAGLVACGKGIGEKNNRVIDGTYIQQKSAISVDGKVTEPAQMENIVEIKGGVRTEYRVNTVMRRVQITKDRLIIKGNSVIGLENIHDECKDENELGVHASDLKITKNANGLILKGKRKKITLKTYDSKELAALSEQIKAGTYDVGCFDATGNNFTKLENSTAPATTKEEDKAAEDAAKTEETKSEEATETAETSEVKSEEGTDADNLQKQVETDKAQELKSEEGTDADNLKPKTEEAAKTTTSTTTEAASAKKTVLN